MARKTKHADQVTSGSADTDSHNSLESRKQTICVVGGGIAGLYSAWALGLKGHNITLFEGLDRFGGRIETLDLEGFKAECGPMRFELDMQPKLVALAQTNLKVRFEKFTPPTGALADSPLHILAEDERSTEQINEEAKLTSTGGAINTLSYLTSSLDLLKLAVYRLVKDHDKKLDLPSVVDAKGKSPSLIAQLADSLWDPKSPDDSSKYDELRTTAMFNGHRLHTLGFWNALARVLSPGALSKVRELGTFYHLIPDNPSASEWSIFWLRLFRSDADLTTIPDGTQAIVKKLVEKIKNLPNVKIFANAKVVGLGYGDSADAAKLTVDLSEAGRPTRQVKIDFDHVVLAIPQWPLRELCSYFPPEIVNDMEGVIGFPLLKAFLVVRKPGWTIKPPPHHGAHLVPTRELHYFDDGNDPPDLGMVMLYTDRPATAYWQPYVLRPHDRAQQNTPPELKSELVWHLLTSLAQHAPRLNPPASPTKMPGSTSLSIDHWAKQIINVAIEMGVNTILKQYKKKDGSIDWNSVKSDLLASATPRLQALLAMDKNKAIEDVSGTVIHYAIRDWSQPPFGAASHAWAPGRNVPDALSRLKAFSLIGRAGVNNIHICGEAYSDYQGFIEGALRSADNVLSTIP